MPLLGTRGAASAQGFGEFAAPSGPATYVENVFSTYLYRGNGTATQPIPNGLQLGGLPANGTVLQLTGDALTDSAPVPCGITNSGVTVSTSVKKYGTGSYAYSGTASNKLIATSPDLAVGTGDFTVECWVYASAVGNQGVFQLGNDFGLGGVFVSMYPDNQFQWGWDSSYTGGVGSWPTSTWVYVTLVRQSGVMKFYVNGTQVGSNNTYAGSINFGRCWVGNYYDGNYALNGYIDDFRITNKALYTSNFTPPSQALPLDTLVAGSNYGGLVWVKSRTSASNNWLIDTNRGILKAISSEITAAELSYPNSVNGFASTGFSLGSNGDWNSTSNNYVSWTFREQPKFFDIVTYTGTGSSLTVSHNLGSTPGCIIIKNYNPGNTDWTVYHRSLGTGAYLQLNNTNASVGSTAVSAVSSTTFTVAGGSANWNSSGQSYVAYIFAHDAGGFGLTGTDNVISCGSYTTGGSGYTSTVNLGYEPQWILYKQANDSGSGWHIIDNMRGWLGSSGSSAYLLANSSASESSQSSPYITPTGFVDPGVVALNATIIYIAIRRGPMKTPTSGTSVYLGSANTASTGVKITTGFPVDLQIAAFRSIATNRFAIDRLRGTSSSTTESSKILRPNATDAEISASYARYWDNTGYQVSSAYADNSMIEWNFGRAPSFMDMVCYTGTGSATTQSHNLGVAPEFMLVKSRSNATDWMVYAAPLGNTQTMYFQRDNPAQVYPAWNNTTPTSTVFSLNGSGYAVNNSGLTYVAYLFASCPGVSKVGSYSGTGATQTISCGFAARFVLIKRTDDYADWLVWDTARGMVAGTDPRIVMNLTSTETNANWVYTDASGFQIVTTDATVNASGGSYIYLAIA